MSGLGVWGFISLAFTGGCLTRADQPDAPIPLSVRHDEEAPSARHSDAKVSRLADRMVRVRDDDLERVTENGDGLRELHAVLDGIGGGLGRIPLELHGSSVSIFVPVCVRPNGLPVSRGGRMLILDDQGAEMPLAVGFTGVLASWSTRRSPTGWSREPRSPDGPHPGAPDVRVIEALATTRTATSRPSRDRARGAPSHGALGPDALAAGPRTPG